MAIHTITLSVIDSRVNVNPDSLKVSPGDSIEWVTGENSAEFDVVIHNTEGFLTDTDRVINAQVKTLQSVTKTISNDTNSSVRYYSVGVTNDPNDDGKVVAPPRIIIHV
jgi:plastocyanin